MNHRSQVLIDNLKADPKTLIRKMVVFQKISADDATYTIHGIFSTEDVDRQGEVIMQDGWNLAEFNLNPVILFCHDSYQPAIGKGLNLFVNGSKQLEGDIQFAAAEYDFAKTIFNLYAGGYMRAFSVGFMNNVYEIDNANDVVILKDNTLLEISAVNVPANAGALAAAKSKSLDVDAVAAAEKKANDHKGKTAEEIEKEKDITPEPVIEKTAAEIAEEAKAVDAKAIETISKSNIDTIRAAAATLNGIVAEAEKAKGLKPAASGVIPIPTLNKAIRKLLEVSRAEKANKK